MSIRQKGLMRDIALNYNELIEAQARVTKELARLAKIIGREGRMTERAVVPAASGEWAAALESVNDLIDDLVRPTTEIARVMDAVADGDLTQKMQLKIGGQPVKGEFLRIGTTVNEMVDQLSSFADEVTRVAREVGTDGKLGGQAEVKGVSGTWRDLTDSVNFMASNLTDQVRNIATVTTAVANGDLSQKITVDATGRDPRAEEHDQHDGRPALVASPTRSPASRARSAPTASSAARPRSRASRAPGATSPRT